jgi:hypothetical protein
VFNLFRTHAAGFALLTLTRRVTGNTFLFTVEQTTAMAFAV